MWRKTPSKTSKKKKRLEKLRSFAIHVFLYLVTAAIVIMCGVLSARALGMAQVVLDDSMEPALEREDVVLLNRIGYRLGSPQRMDLVAMTIGSSENSPVYLRRVIGLPGDTVRITGGVVYVNNEAIEFADNTEAVSFAGQAENEIKLEPDTYFVLCDNYNASNDDSRRSSIGTVSRRQIIGKVWAIAAPWSRMGKL
jgi:signal peptidase I